MPEISIVIATFNRVHLLQNCLSSIESQDFPKHLFELLVINDGSTDNTQKFLEQFLVHSSLNVRIFSHKNKGVALSRNIGIAKAKSKHIVFTDDDCVLPVSWLSRLYNRISLSGPDISGVGGPLNPISTDSGNATITRFINYLDEFNHTPVFGKIRILTNHVSDISGPITVPYLRTSNAIFRASHLRMVNGFDPCFKRPGGEDPDLCYRLISRGFKLTFDPAIVVAHDSRDSFQSYFRSLKNYIIGEKIKARKIVLYKNSIIKMNYTLIPVQKALSVIYQMCQFPKIFLDITKNKSYKKKDALLFPAILILSKFYAFILSVVDIKHH